MPNIFYAADLHFGHKNILRLCSRPFSSVEEMDDAIVARWNAKVKPDDIAYIVGDVSMKNAKYAVQRLQSMNGEKHLIIGNHDRHLLKSEEFRACFVERTNYAYIRDNGREVVLCHYPFAEWDGMYHGTYHVYGHIHNSKNDTYRVMRDKERAYNAGVDITDFEPCTLDELMTKNSKFRKDG